MDDRYTRSQIHCGAAFMDHTSSNSFTHLQCLTGDIETIAVNRSYELYVDSFVVTITSYHVCNSFLAKKSFRNEVNEFNQKINVCDMSAHRQNKIVENHNDVLTCISRSLPLHAQRRWPNLL